MNKMIIWTVVLVTLFLSCILLLTNLVMRGINEDKNKYKVEIGQKIILEKDTLIVIDYSSTMETFTLSNGKIVNASIVFDNDSISVK